MSEYGTEQFIDWLGGQISTHPYITPVVTRTTAKENKAMLNAIIAKLRAGNNLCETSKKLLSLISINTYTGCAFSSLVIRKEYEATERAIAEYGEKEK